MYHIYSVHLFGLHTAISTILQGYAAHKIDVMDITFSQNTFLRLVEELNLNNNMIKKYEQIFTLPLSINSDLLPFTIVIQSKDVKDVKPDKNRSQ